MVGGSAARTLGVVVVGVVLGAGCYGAGGVTTGGGGVARADAGGGSLDAASDPAGESGPEVDAAPVIRHVIELTGSAQVPGPGRPGGSGSATVTLVPARNEVCVELEVAGLDQPTAAHIHESPAGESGEVVLALPAPSTGDDTVDACVTASATLLGRIDSSPDRFYLDVHSDAHPNGAVRGQLG